MTPILILDLDNTIKGEFYLDTDALRNPRRHNRRFNKKFIRVKNNTLMLVILNDFKKLFITT